MMGTRASKLEEKEINGIKYQTSPYGWGKLQHPVKPKNPDQRKPKKKKWVDPTINMNKNDVLKNPADVASITPQQNKTIDLIKKDPHKKTQRNQAATNDVHKQKKNRLSGSLIDRPSTNGVADVKRKYFYGQFRCHKCLRYWRSGLTIEGTAQTCPRCKAQVFPSKS